MLHASLLSVGPTLPIGSPYGPPPAAIRRALPAVERPMFNDQRDRGARPDTSNVRTAQQYAAQAIGRADLTRAVAEAAMEKASRPDVREFAGYELMEAKAIISVLQELGAQVAPQGTDAKSVLDLIDSASKG